MGDIVSEGMEVVYREEMVDAYREWMNDVDLEGVDGEGMKWNEME